MKPWSCSALQHTLHRAVQRNESSPAKPKQNQKKPRERLWARALRRIQSTWRCTHWVGTSQVAPDPGTPGMRHVLWGDGAHSAADGKDQPWSVCINGSKEGFRVSPSPGSACAMSCTQPQSNTVVPVTPVQALVGTPAHLDSTGFAVLCFTQ